MVTFSLLISIAALALAGIALWRVTQLVETPTRSPPLSRYTLTGSIRITNDCDGQQASIPAQVTIETRLSNAGGSIEVGGNTSVNLAPDPADPNAPAKIGTYTVTVSWPDGQGKPQHWIRPKILDRPGGRPVCETIGCPVGGTCYDGATGARTIPFSDPATSHDIRVSCTCSS